MKNEKLAILNTIATAEGTIQIAMEESTILDFVSSQSFTRFEKNDDGSLSKNIQNNVHVKVLLNTQL